MTKVLIKWDIYEVRSEKSSLNGVMLRGRIRKFGLERTINLLAENTQDVENAVRFAVTNDRDAAAIIGYLEGIIADVKVELKLQGISNPVLSKLKVNSEARYVL